MNAHIATQNKIFTIFFFFYTIAAENGVKVQHNNLGALGQVFFVLPFGNVNAGVMHRPLVHHLALREVLHLSVCHLSNRKRTPETLSLQLSNLLPILTRKWKHLQGQEQFRHLLPL